MSAFLRLHAAAAALAVAGASGGVLAATEYATVVSSTPVIGTSPVAERVCADETVTTAPRPTGAGAIAGALIGGVVGNQIGHGAGRAAATGLGVVLGSAAGNQAEANAQGPNTAVVQNCRTVTRQQERVIGYDVVYDHAGTRRTARLAQDPGGPGTRMAVDVQVTPSSGRVASTGRGTPVPLAGSPEADVPVGVPAPGEPRDEYAPRYRYAPRYESAPRTYVAPYPAPVYYVPAPMVVAPPVVYGPPFGASLWIGGRWGHHHGR